jgi:hypothetical protein
MPAKTAQIVKDLRFVEDDAHLEPGRAGVSEAAKAAIGHSPLEIVRLLEDIMPA